MGIIFMNTENSKSNEPFNFFIYLLQKYKETLEGQYA